MAEVWLWSMARCTAWIPGWIRDRDAVGNNDRMRVSAPSRISVGVGLQVDVSGNFGVIENLRDHLTSL